MNRKGKKGTTLAELVIVLALVAIVSAMVTSFSILMSRRVSLSTARLNAIDDMQVMESMAEGWIGQMRLKGAALSLQKDEGSDRTRLQAVVEEKTYTLSFNEEEKVLEGTLPDGSKMSFAPTEVHGVEFGCPDSLSADDLFFCTLIYDLPSLGGSEGPQKMPTFCLNPRVGESGGGTE